MTYRNSEFTETAHATFKISQRLLGLKIIRKIGTEKHKKNHKKSIIWNRSRRAGFNPPSKFRIRNSK